MQKSAIRGHVCPTHLFLPIMMTETLNYRQYIILLIIVIYYYLVCIILLNSYVPAGYFLLMSRLCVSHNQFN